MEEKLNIDLKQGSEKDSKNSKRGSEYESDCKLKKRSSDNHILDSESTLLHVKFDKVTKSLKYLLISTTAILIAICSVAIGFGIKDKYILSFNFVNEYNNSMFVNHYPFLTNLFSILIILGCNISKKYKYYILIYRN